MRTQVGIVGAGPAGLLLARLLHLEGIESIVIERRSRDYVEKRVKAGVLEQSTVDLLDEVGVSERLHKQGLVHHGIELRFDGRRHRILLTELSGGRSITVYGQQKIVKDLISARLADDQPLIFEAEGMSLEGLRSDRPNISFRHNGSKSQIECDFIAGCDGFHGISRDSIPADVLTRYERDYFFGWLGILAEVAPSSEELIYANHPDGFALHSMRSRTITRLYLQCDADEDLAEWSDERIWDELGTRLNIDGWSLRTGPIIDKGITEMRSFVVEPMQYGRLFLAGDAAHIVPPTGAKGLNLAAADVKFLSQALKTWYRLGDREPLDAYGIKSLRRVWRAEHFSWWMTSMLHRVPNASDFDRKLQLAQLEYVCSSRAAATTLAENYVGFPLDV
jgi:p-hydroxybenzoate 3-monooxygenase